LAKSELNFLISLAILDFNLNEPKLFRALVVDSFIKTTIREIDGDYKTMLVSLY
jgi:hypothetical protein